MRGVELVSSSTVTYALCRMNNYTVSAPRQDGSGLLSCKLTSTPCQANNYAISTRSYEFPYELSSEPPSELTSEADTRYGIEPSELPSYI